MIGAFLRRWAGAAAPRAPEATPPEAPVRRLRGYTGDFQPLHVYLRDRFADRIVLTFSEIEDLNGRALPAAARLEPEWWSEPGQGLKPTTQAEAWILASRSAVVNMSASTILFERLETPRSGT